jgi:hypothetical protein
MNRITMRQIFISMGIFIGAAFLVFQVRAFDLPSRMMLEPAHELNVSNK